MARAIVNDLGQGLDGDKTTTGATCIGNWPWSTQDGRDVLRVGDKTTPCPKCGQVGTIVEGSPAIHWGDLETALHGALIQCGCPRGDNRLVAWPEPEWVMEAPPQSRSFTSTPSPAAPSTAARSSSKASFASSGTFSTAEDNEPAEPGFYLVPKSLTRQQLVDELFGNRPSPEVMRKFNGLNSSLGDGIVKAGQLVVLADPRNYMCMREEAHLMEAAEEVAVALADLEPEDADFMFEYQAQIAAILGIASTWTGVAAAGMEKNLGDITKTLQKLEALYADTYRAYGRLNVPEFFSQRKVILDELDGKLLNSAKIRSALSLGDHKKLHKSLRISSKSLVHHWKKSGGPGKIPGYSSYVNSMTKATNYMKHGGYLAISIGGISSALKIKEACETGSSDTCRRVAITETATFTSVSLGGIAGAKLGVKESPYVCYKLAVNPGKYAICTIAVVAGSAYVGGEFGAKIGDAVGGKAVQIGDVIHDHFLYD